MAGQRLQVALRLVGVRVEPGPVQLGPHPRVFPGRQVIEDAAFLMDPAPLDECPVAIHVFDRAAQRLATVDHKQDPALGGQPTVAQIADQAADDGGVLARAFHHAQRHLRPVGSHPERADHGVAGEVEPVDEADQPVAVGQVGGAERVSRSAVAARNRRETADRDVAQAASCTTAPTCSSQAA